MSSRTPFAAHARPKKKAKLLRQVARGALLAVSLTAVQFGAEEKLEQRMFDRGLLDRLKAPLTRYHE